MTTRTPGETADSGAEGESTPFRMIVVCTGNICRSAAAEQILREELTVRDNGRLSSRIEVTSAGTGAVVGGDIHPFTARAMQEHGFSPEPHRGRLLTVEDVERADLVLAATRDHRDAITATVPQAGDRAFTLLEFARLVEDISGHQGPRDLVREAARIRGERVLQDAAQDDIEDPISGGMDDHNHAVGQIVTAAHLCAAMLCS